VPDQDLYTSALCAWLANRKTQGGTLPNLRINWERFVRAAAESAVLPALSGQNSLERTVICAVPEDVSAALILVNTLNAERNRTALVQAQQLAAAMNQVGIQPVALKGLANILAGIYPDLGARYLADIDLLVPPEDFPAAVAVLHNLSYSAYPAHSIEFVIGHSYPALTRADSLEVDLHRTVGLGACASFLPATEVFRDSVPHNLDGASIRIPSPEHLVTHHIMHSQMHDSYRERINPSLRTLYDFFLLERHFHASLDWHAIEHRFRQKGQYATFALFLIEVEQSFGLKPPIALSVSTPLKLRRRRRQLLQSKPALRFLDPSYYFLAGVRPRTRRLREILAQPGCWQYLFQKLYEPKFYARLRHDLG